MNDKDINVFRRLRSRYDTDKKDFKASELSKKIGLSTKVISVLENSEKNGHEPTLNELKAYHKEFNVPYEYLLGESESEVYENQALWHETGLSDHSMDVLKNLKELSKRDTGLILMLQSIDHIIGSPYGYDFLFHLSTFLFGIEEVKGHEGETYVRDLTDNKIYIQSKNYNPAFEVFKLIEKVKALKSRKPFELFSTLEDMKHISSEESLKMLQEYKEKEERRSARYKRVSSKGVKSNGNSNSI